MSYVNYKQTKEHSASTYNLEQLIFTSAQYPIPRPSVHETTKE